MAALRGNHDFFKLLSGTAISSVGDQVTLLALPAMVLALTGSVAQTGLVSAIEALPFLGALHIGQLIDSHDRRRILVGAEFVGAAAIASVPIADSLHVLGMAQLYVVALLEGLAMVAFSVGRTAVLRFLLPARSLKAGIAASSAAESAAQLVGPAVAGLLLTWRPGVTGPSIAFGLDAASFLVCGLLVLTIRTRLGRAEARPKSSAFAGVRILLGDTQLRLVVSFSVARALLVSPGIILLFAQAHRLGLGASAIGAVFSLSAVGGLIGSAAAVPIAARMSIRSVSVLVNLILASAYALQAIAPDFAVLLAGELVYSVAFPILSSAQLAYRVSLMPDEFAGRINAAFRAAVYGARPLGLAAGGLLMGFFGPRAVLAGVSLGLIVCAVAAAGSRLGAAAAGETVPATSAAAG